MGTPARVVIAAPLPRLPLTAVAPARTRAPNTALVLAAIILDARSVESTSPASIRRAVERSIARSIERAIAPSRPRAIVSPITTRREGGATATTTEGGGRDHRSRLVAVSTRRHASDFYYPRGPDAYMCGTHPYAHPHRAHLFRTFDRDRADPAPIARVSRRLGRFFAGTVAHGGAREDDGRRRRETGDERRETGDERRETGDARRETRAETTSVSTSRRGRPWDEARGRRRCAFSTRVWARGRDSFAGHHSSWVTIRTDSRNRDESRRRRREGGRDLCRAVSGVF